MQGTKAEAQGQKVLKICIMSADFWGLKTAGGTATAYHLLAAVLSKNKANKVRCCSDRCELGLGASRQPDSSSLNVVQRMLCLTTLELPDYQLHALAAQQA